MIKIFFSAIALLLAACSSSPNHEKHVKIGATAVPHAEILEQIKPDLKKNGINLDIIIVEDYNTPNRALADGDLDANFFQHTQFMKLQEKEFGYQFETLAKVHIEPMGLYSLHIHSLKDLKDGSVVALPSDPTNQARALLLLEKQGLIKLSRRDIGASLLNINGNPKRLKFVEVDPPLLSRTLDDVDLAAITTNFALQGGLSPKHALAIEDKDSPFVNIVAVRKGDSQRLELQKLKEALNSDKVKNFIKEHYQNVIIPVQD